MKSIYQAVMLFVVLTILCGIFYPAIVTATGKMVFSDQSEGFLLKVEGRVVGSKLIAQHFRDQKYFWPRPSAGHYETVPSGASNLGPTNRELVAKVQERRALLSRVNEVDEKDVPADLLMTSASGLDPDISIASAKMQVKRIAKARGVDEAELMHLIDGQAQGVQFALFGEPRVNVLLLNLTLDAWALHERKR